MSDEAPPPIPPHQSLQPPVRGQGGGVTGGQESGLDLSTAGPSSQPPLNPAFQSGQRAHQPTPEQEETDFANSALYSNVATSESSQGDHYENALSSCRNLSTEDKDRLFKQLQAERVQSLYPSALVNQELDNLDGAISENEEQIDLVTHKLQTVQGQRDDLGEASKIMSLKATAADEEIKLSILLNEAKQRQVSLERAQKGLLDVKRGQISDEKEIGNRIKQSQNLTGYSGQVLYSSVKKQNKKKVQINDDKDDSDESSNDLFEVASETIDVDGISRVPTPSSNRPKNVTRPVGPSERSRAKAKMRSESTKKTTGPTKEDDNMSTLSSSSFFDDNPANIMFVTLQTAKDEATEVLNEEIKEEISLKHVLEKLKGSIKYFQDNARNLRVGINEKEEIDDLFKDLRTLEKAVVKEIGEANKKERMLKFAPRAVIPSFNNKATGFVQFLAEFEKATESFSKEQKVTALKRAVTGKEEKEKEELARIFNNTSDYDVLIEELSKRLGNLSVLLPIELSKVTNLKKAANHDVEQEIANIQNIKDFWKLLQIHKKTHFFDNTVFRATKKSLRDSKIEDIRNRPLKTYGEIRKDELKAYKEIKEEKEKATGVKDKFLEEKVRDLNTAKDNDNEISISAYLKRLDFYLDNDYEERNEKGEKQTKENSGHKERKTHLYNSNQSPGKGKCNICKGNSSHFTSECKSLTGKKTKDEIIQHLHKHQVCEKCLNPQGEGHKANCERYFDKGKNCYRFKTCRCRSGLNYRLCCPNTNKTQNDAGSSPSLPSTAAHNMHADLDNETDNEDVLINGVPVGLAIGKSQVIKMFTGASAEDYIRILAIFDNWSNSTMIDKSLIQFMSNKKDLIYQLLTMGSRSYEKGAGTIHVEIKGKRVPIQGLIKKFEKRPIPKVKVKAPKKWKDDHLIESDIITASGLPQIIFGTDQLHLFPVDIECTDGLLLSRSQFDNKAIVSGFNSNLCEVLFEEKMDSAPTTNLNFTHQRMNAIDSAWLEEMNPSKFVIQPKLCSECRELPECPKCKLEILTKTPSEMIEEKLLDDETKHSEEDHCWVIDAPFKDSLTNLPSYESEVVASMTKLENKLRKIPQGKEIAETLDKHVQDNIAKGVYIYEDELLKKEPDFKKYQESFQPCNYSCKESGSHSIRMVHNLSFSRGGKPSFNSTQLKGGSLNHKIHFILLNGRGWRYQVYQDLSRMYNSVYISRRTSALCKMKWKKNGLLSSDPFVTLVTLVLQFGMVMAQHISNYCKIQTSKKYVEPLSPAAHKVVCSGYTDDLASGSMKTMEEAEKIAHIIETQMPKGNFKTKPAVKSLDKTAEGPRSMPGSSTNLGMFHFPNDDSWGFKTTLNLKPKVRGVRPSDGELDSVEKIREWIKTHGISKKEALALAHCVWDPLNLLYPIKLNVSYLYRLVLAENPQMNWHSKISPSLHDHYIAVLQQVLAVKTLRIPRCPIPDDYDEKIGLQLHFFNDGSSTSSCSKCYIRVPTKDPDKFITAFLCASLKLAELGVNSAPKTEVNSLLLSCRLLETILQCWDHIKISRICFFSDSKVILASLNTFYAKLKLFFTSRILECQTTIRKHNVEVHYVPSEKNYSNEGSKFDPHVNHVLTEDYWVARFLEKKEEFWPVEKIDVSENALKDIKNKIITNTYVTEYSELCINQLLLKNKKFDQICRIVAYVFKFLIPKASLPDMIEKAKSFLYSLAKPDQESINGLKRQFIVEFSEENNVHLVTRAFQLENQILQQKLILLDGKGLIGKSLIRQLHKHCTGTERELSGMIENNLYLTHARSLLRKYASSCIVCARLRQEKAKFTMGPSIQQLSSAHPPYWRSFCDITGPFYCKLTKFTKKKFWIAGVCCVWSRHVTYSMLLDLTASEFLQTLKTVSYQNGGSLPRYLHSDFGSQIVTITKINDKVEDYDEDENEGLKVDALKKTLSENKIELVLSSPKAPFRQSLCESLFKILKMTMKRSNLTSQSFHITQWVHILAFLSYTVNTRPISVRFNMENLSVITSQKLLYGGRNNYFYPARLDLDLSANKLYNHLTKLEEELKAWRNVWHLTYLQEVKKIMKFKEKSHLIEEDALVMISDHLNEETRQPALGIVLRKLSERTFEILYIKKHAKLDLNGKILKKAVHSTLTRPIQSLIFLFNTKETSEASIDPFWPDETSRNLCPQIKVSPAENEITSNVNNEETLGPASTPELPQNGEEHIVQGQEEEDAASHQGDLEYPDNLQTYNVPGDTQTHLEDEFSASVINDKESQQNDIGTKVKFVRDSPASKMIDLPQRKLRPRKS